MNRRGFLRALLSVAAAATLPKEVEAKAALVKQAKYGGYVSFSRKQLQEDSTLLDELWKKVTLQIKAAVPQELFSQVEWIYIPPVVGSADPLGRCGYIGWRVD